MIRLPACSLALGLFFSLPADIKAEPVSGADFEYLGAFQLPREKGEKHNLFAYGQRGLTFDAAGDPVNEDAYPGSLWMTGHDYTEEIFEISIPDPVKSRSTKDLNTAELLTPAIDFTDGCSGSSDWFAGLEIQDEFIWGSCANWYNVSGRSSPEVLWRRTLALTDLQGPFHAGSLKDKVFHSNRQGAYLVEIPESFADAHLGGRSLATGFSRNSHGGQLGPTLLAFDPEEPKSGFDVFWYRQPAGSICGNKCDFPSYTPCDRWWGAAWVQSADGAALLISGIKFYGESTYVTGKGHECGPGFGEVLVYDSHDLVARTEKKLKPWQVVPKEFWRPGDLWDARHELGGMAFDSSNKFLYLVEKSAAGNGVAMVHVYRLRASS